MARWWIQGTIQGTRERERKKEEREKKRGRVVERRHSRNFNESEFSRFHRNFLGAVPRENRIKPAVDGRVYRIASLSATPRIRTNIFSKQLDWVELEEEGGGRGGSGKKKGYIVPRAKWWVGSSSLCIAKG